MSKFMCFTCDSAHLADGPFDHYASSGQEAAWIDVTHVYRAGQEEMRERAAQCIHDMGTMARKEFELKWPEQVPPIDDNSLSVEAGTRDSIRALPLEGDE